MVAMSLMSGVFRVIHFTRALLMMVLVFRVVHEGNIYPRGVYVKPGPGTTFMAPGRVGSDQW